MLRSACMLWVSDISKSCGAADAIGVKTLTTRREFAWNKSNHKLDLSSPPVAILPPNQEQNLSASLGNSFHWTLLPKSNNKLKQRKSNNTSLENCDFEISPGNLLQLTSDQLLEPESLGQTSFDTCHTGPQTLGLRTDYMWKSPDVSIRQKH